MLKPIAIAIALTFCPLSASSSAYAGSVLTTIEKNAARGFFNGGAAVAVLAFLGALVRQDGVTVKQIAGVSSSLLWFAGGVAMAAWALGLSYFTNYCYGRDEKSKTWTLEPPYINDTDAARWWRRWAYAFHGGALVWAFLALLAFIVGM